MSDFDCKKIYISNSANDTTVKPDINFCNKSVDTDFEVSKNNLLEKFMQLKSESEKAGNIQNIRLYNKIYAECLKITSPDDLAKYQRLYEEIVYKKVSHQYGVNNSALINSTPLQTIEGENKNRLDERLNFQQKTEFIKNELEELKFDKSLYEEAKNLLKNFDEANFERVFNLVLNGKLDIYNAILGVDAGLKDECINQVLNLLKNKITVYEAIYLNDNFSKEQALQLIDTAKSKKISVYEADCIVSDILENNDKYTFEEAAQFACLDKEKQESVQSLINKYGITPLDSIITVRFFENEKQYKDVVNFLITHPGTNAMDAVNYFKLNDEQKSSADKLLADSALNENIPPEKIIETVSLINEGEKLNEAIAFLSEYPQAQAKDSVEYINLNEIVKTKIKNLLSKPEYGVLKPSDAIFIAENIFTRAETDKIVKFIEKYPDTSAESVIKYNNLDSGMKRNVDEVLKHIKENELPADLIINVAQFVSLSTPEELEMAVEFCHNNKEAGVNEAADYIILGNNKLRKKTDNILNNKENVSCSKVLSLACAAGENFDKNIEFLIKHPELSVDDVLTYTNAAPVTRDIQIKNILSKNKELTLSDAISLLDYTSAQINRALNFRKTHPDITIKEACYYASCPPKIRMEIEKILADEEYKGLDINKVMKIMKYNPDDYDRKIMLGFLKKFPDSDIYNVLEYKNIEEEKRAWVDEIINKPEFKKAKTPQELSYVTYKLKSKEEIQKAVGFMLKHSDCTPMDAVKAASLDDEVLRETENLLDIYPKLKPKDAITIVAAKGYLEGKEYHDKIKKIIQQPQQNDYQAALTDIAENINIKTKESLFNLNLTEDDFYNALKLLNSSTFKKAYKTPNEFLSDIDIKYTTKINEKYPLLPEEELKSEQERIKEFFAENLALIVRALKYLDTDTVNQMMSKRTNSFNRSLLNINMLSDDNLELLSKLIKKTNSTKNKLELCQLMRLCRVKSDNKSILKEMAQKDVITMEMINTAKRKVKEEFLNGILINIGFLKDEIEKIPLEKLNFNEEYIHTLNDLRGESAYNLIHSYINDDFSKYIKDKSNEYGQANAKTKAAFAKNKLNYDKWLNPNIEDEIIKINGKNYKFKIWDRNPQEDLFIGNKTNCCTAIGGSNGEATPIYLLNTAFNVVELCDEDGNTAAMARVFAGKINNKPALIMDTLETSLNTGTIELRNAFFEYMKKYSKAVTGKENTPVYYSSSYAKVPTSDLEKKDVFVGFIGNVYPDSVYINSKQNWIDPALMKCSGYTELYRAV